MPVSAGISILIILAVCTDYICNESYSFFWSFQKEKRFQRRYSILEKY